MSIAALITMARTWKQPKCPSADKWIKNMWYIYTMDYYSGIKRNKTGPFVEMWMDLERVIESEVSQKKKNISYINTYIWNLENWYESESCSVMSNSLRPHRLYSPWNSLGQNTGVGSLSLLQGIFPIQGLNPDLPHYRQIPY